MRAAEDGAHISGGERLVPAEGIEAMVQALVRRALTHELGQPDSIHVTVERVDAAEVRGVSALRISKIPVETVEQGRAAAVDVLDQAGIAREAAEQAVRWIAAGAGPDGTVMRGAIVMDADTGARLESDPARGVRVSRIDWHPEVLARWQDAVRAEGIANERIAEALAIASKVSATGGTVAELCWSDDPGYVSGYVASPELGYVRIPHLKELGSPLGGRVFFVRGMEAQAYEQALQTPVLIDQIPDPAVVRGE
jgi:6-carboxyhexanoate--CoA ligase